MTGPEHYQRAEELSVQAYELAFVDGERDDAVFMLKEAQLHATLALAAATAPEWATS